MRSAPRVLSALALSAVAATLAYAQEAPVGTKPQLGVYADTTQSVIPGLDKLPAEARAAIAARAANRSLSVHLWTPGKVPVAPAATLDIPAGLKLGNTLPLEIPKSTPGNGTGSDASVQNAIAKFEFLRYWGCSATVRPGQPKVIKSGGISGAELSRLARAGEKAGAGADSDPWISAHWPNTLQQTPPTIQPGAALPGKYALHGNYVKAVNFEVPSNVNFLDPVTVTPGEQNLEKAVTFSWKPVPGAIGYIAMATGMRGKTTMIMWTSSETENGFDQGYAPTSEIKALVEKGIYLPASKTECIIPAGIFKGCQFVSLQVVAYGPSFTQATTVPSVRVQTRSIGTLTLGLGGGFGGNNDGDDDKEDDDEE